MTDKVKNIVVTIMFLFFVILIFFINIIKKDDTISIAERRKLEQLPSFSISKLFNGTFFKKFDLYVTDQFVKRQNMRKLKANVELNIFKKKDYDNLYKYKEYIIGQTYPLNESSVQNIADKITQIKKENLTDENNIYFSIVPDKNYFVNEDNLKLDYNKIEYMLKENLQFAKYINIFDELQLSDYYKTDTHWKQENLLKVANTIANEMNVKIENEYEQKSIIKFEGAYAGQLPLGTQEDEIKILTNDILENCKVYNYETKEYTKIYDMSKKDSLDKYDIYLSGAVPLLTIENDKSESTKELVVFRDSYASSLIPLLVSGYKKITVVDTRYISPKILNEYINFSNQDILFIYSILIINNSTSLK